MPLSTHWLSNAACTPPPPAGMHRAELCFGTSLLPAPNMLQGLRRGSLTSGTPGDYLPRLVPARTRETKPPALLLGSMVWQPDEMIKLWGTISSGEELRCLSLPTEVKSQPCDCPALCQTGSEEEGTKARPGVSSRLCSPPARGEGTRLPHWVTWDSPGHRGTSIGWVRGWFPDLGPTAPTSTGGGS